MTPDITNVVQLPGMTRSCEDCKWFYSGQLGLFCGLFREELWSCRVAEDCEEYTR